MQKTPQKKQCLDLISMVLLLVLCASWGLQQVSIKYANQSIPPVLQAGLRSIGALVLLSIWMAARHEKLLEKDGSLWWGIGAGILFSIEFLLIYWGLKFTSASRAVVFLYTMPFAVALGAQLFIPGEKLRFVHILGLVCAFCGIVTAFSDSLGASTRDVLIGDSMLVAAALTWAAVTIIIKASPLVYIKASKTLFYQLATSALLLPLGSLVLNEPAISRMTPITWACLLYQIVWVAFITYLTWFWLIRNYPASRLAGFMFLTPLFGVLAGVVLMNESLTRALMLALSMVAIGIYLVNRPAVAQPGALE